MPFKVTLAALAICLLADAAAARPVREQFTVPTPSGQIRVESFGTCAKSTCPAVLILSGSKGFGASAYDEIGRTFAAAGLDAYLVNVLSPADLKAIATAEGAGARIAYYGKRLKDWISAVRGVAAYLDGQPRHGGKLAVLGISLGAQIASAATSGQGNIDALVLVDGGFPNGYAPPPRALPPLLLIWGSADRTFPLPTGRDLQRKAQQLGGTADLDIYEGGAHDFFLKSATRNADAAHRSAAKFLATELSR